jgi:8-oxo-dGTP diphosphatase
MIHVTCAIILDKDRVLAAQRGRNTHLAGQWEFLGGKVIEGESEEACIIREIREELGIEVRPVGRLTENMHDYGEKQIRLIPFICELVSGEPVAREHASVGWYLPEALRTLDWCAADIPIVDELLATTTSKRSRP